MVPPIGSWHIGSPAGTAAIAVTAANGFSWAAVCNSRDDAHHDQMLLDLDLTMWALVDRIGNPAGGAGPRRYEGRGEH